MNLPATSRPTSTPNAAATGNAAAATINSASSSDSNSKRHAGGECGNCGRKENLLIHHVRLRAIYRRLCTACVLRLHPSSFCPVCFTVYGSSPPPPSKRLNCSKCSSYTHSHCATATSTSTSSGYHCPPCADSNFSFFPWDPDRRVIDKKSATALLCAARIASVSMANALVVARTEAERRAREAAACRKRAREALENVLLLASKDKGMAPVAGPTAAKTNEAEAMEVSGSGVAKTVGGSSAGGMVVDNCNNNGDKGDLVTSDVEKKPALPMKHVKEQSFDSFAAQNKQ